ncbi:MAG: transglycosylase SLT domain-containing protein [Hyphomicrobiales bacterium]
MSVIPLPRFTVPALACVLIVGTFGVSQAAQRFSPPNPVAHPAGTTALPASTSTSSSSAIGTAHALARQAQASITPLFTGSIGGNASAAARALEPLSQALANDQGQRAYAIAQAITDPATRDLGLWMIARTRADDLPLELRTAFRDAFSGWPGAGIIAQQTDVAMMERYGNQVPPLSLFGTGEARTTEARLAQAQALAQAGQTQDARRIASELWRTDVLDDGLENRLLSSLGSHLTQDDHRFRAHWLLYRDRVTGAERVAQYLPSADQNSVAVRGRAIRDGASARDLVRRAHEANPGDIHITYELARLYRRADQPREAARLLRSVRQSGDALVRPDIWWRERHIVARDLIETRQPEGAYQLTTAPTGSSAGDEAQRAFLAGWIALRFLDDPARAEPHFRQILEIGTTPITRARGYYWLGRTLSARGDTTGANQAFAQAMTYGETFYGQAASTITGLPIRFEQVPRAQTPGHAYFSYADALYTLDRRTDARLFLYSLARNGASPAEIAGMAALASRHGDATSVVQLGKIGALRHRSLALLGYPTGAFPQDARIPERLPQAVAYAISRQESGFDARARSHAGALGLMQLMPETARRIARDVGVSHSTARLTSDPAHNVTLGAYHLDELIAEYNGSYILTFIAYNAGPRRVPQWIERFGDPRSGQIDVIDWIELIPFSETRSYVQRVLENIFVYQQITANG